MTDRPPTKSLTTIRGYALGDVASALQKTIRRGDARLAGYFAIELFESGYAAYAWRRLLTISAEDCAGVITQEVAALFEAWRTIDAKRKATDLSGNLPNKSRPRGRVFLAKAVILLCQSPKSRDADHLTNLVYDKRGVDEAVLLAELEDARREPVPIPDYAYDVHTREGRRRGKTKREFFIEEHDALSPRVPGLFDGDLETLRTKGGR